MNAAMMMKGRVSSIIADSFDGRTLNSSFSSDLIKERESAMKDEDARGFYEWCLGPDWQDIVQKDTKALIECADRGDSLFVSPPSALDCPVLLTGSVEDLMCRSDMKEEYGEMKKMSLDPYVPTWRPSFDTQQCRGIRCDCKGFHHGKCPSQLMP